MHLRTTLPIFALLLIASVVISFLGYRYLSLASEYRAANFRHLIETQDLLSFLGQRYHLHGAQIEPAIAHVELAQEQAQWCLDVLSNAEKRLFVLLGAGQALVICADNVATTNRALDALNKLVALDVTTVSGEASLYDLGMNVREEAAQMRAESLAFQPYVSIIEKKLKRMVKTGTLVAAAGISLVFMIVSRELARGFSLLAQKSEELAELAAISERANDSIIVTDIDGRVTWVNPAFESLTGYSLNEMEGRRPSEMLQGPETDSAASRQIRDALAVCEPIKLEILNYTRDGDAHWVDLSIAPLENGAGEVYGFMSISTDVTKDKLQRDEIQAVQWEIEHQAHHDPLTGLPNRRMLESALTKRRARSDAITIIRIDLDHFKYVNDTMGHDAGDFVLQEVSRILRDEMEEGDLPVRVGGDEFVVLMREGKTSAHGLALADTLLVRIKAPMRFKNKSIRVGASFGVASSADALLDSESLVIGADAALYEAKELGRNRSRLYTTELHAALQERRSTARELKRAVAHEEFEPYFQPQFDAATGEIVGVETLARWNSSTLGFVTPDRFLPVAERLSMIEEIDDLIFRKAIECVSQLNSEGFQIAKVSVNVTAQRVQDPRVLDLVQRWPDRDFGIAFEVLESVLVEEQGNAFQFGVDRLREAGVTIEIDDFGSGHASIIGLMQLRPDAMKIDQRLVRRVISDPVNLEVLRNIVGIAQSMNLTVVAEGVETLEHAETLAKLGCHVLQGYAFCKPMSTDDLRQFLTSYRPAALGFAQAS